MNILILLFGAVVLDLLIGDPSWIPHPVVLIGKLISKAETLLRKAFRKAALCRKNPGSDHPAVYFGSYLPIIMGLLPNSSAVWTDGRNLLGKPDSGGKIAQKESMKVYEQLEKGDLPKARYAVSMIVGRDTQNLDETGVTKAAVETVAENTSDGIIAPMFYLAIGGTPLAMCYKAINTLDSMVGYKNENISILVALRQNLTMQQTLSLPESPGC